MNKLYYMGLRFNGEKLSQSFMTERGETVFFNKIKSVYIGYAYAWDAEKSTIKIRPEQLEEDIHESSDQWFALHIRAKQIHKEKQALIRYSKHGTYGSIIFDLKPKVKNLSYSEIKSLVEYLVNEARKK